MANDSDKEAREVLIKFSDLNSIYHLLGEAGEVIRAFYPGANWAERKGAKLMMEELDQAQEMCLQVIRPVLQEEREAAQTRAEEGE